MTPLMLACLSGHPAVVEILIARGAHVNAHDAVGRTALWFATLASDLRLVRQLLAAGANPLIADSDGWSPMDLAIELRQRRMIRLFTAQ
jgi:ankyrin repeat protein